LFLVSNGNDLTSDKKSLKFVVVFSKVDKDLNQKYLFFVSIILSPY